MFIDIFYNEILKIPNLNTIKENDYWKLILHTDYCWNKGSIFKIAVRLVVLNLPSLDNSNCHISGEMIFLKSVFQIDQMIL